MELRCDEDWLFLQCWRKIPYCSATKKSGPTNCSATDCSATIHHFYAWLAGGLASIKCHQVLKADSIIQKWKFSKDTERFWHCWYPLAGLSRKRAYFWSPDSGRHSQQTWPEQLWPWRNHLIFCIRQEDFEHYRQDNKTYNNRLWGSGVPHWIRWNRGWWKGKLQSCFNCQE